MENILRFHFYKFLIKYLFLPFILQLAQTLLDSQNQTFAIMFYGVEENLEKNQKMAQIRPILLHAVYLNIK